jgi:acetyl-CoA synthetase
MMHVCCLTTESEVDAAHGGFVKTRLSAYEYRRGIAFIEAMPMTATGKVIRRLLRGAAASG